MRRGQRKPTPQELAVWVALIRREAGAQVDVRNTEADVDAVAERHAG